MAAPTWFCPRGFDCAYRTSCPNATLACPPGFFCDTYLGRPDEKALDALFLDWNGKNAYIPPSRFVALDCFRGYSCANATSLVRCPSGSWCPEGEQQPTHCSGLSLCPGGTAYEINFTSALLSLLLAICVGSASAVLIASQRSQARATRARGTAMATASRTTASNLKRPAGGSGDAGAGVTLQFTDLSVTAGGRELLHRVSGTFAAGRLTAIMGPSGCGKSVLLATLRGRAPGSCTGTVTLSGRAVSASQFGALNHVVAAVPQEDVIDRRLTVRETLWFSGRARLPASLPDADVAAQVNKVMSDLQLQEVADVVVGGSDSAAASISGGQLKRVNIAVEMVSLPRAILLDAPTAGLDASTSLELWETLRGIAAGGVTVAAILGQPRVELFNAVDHLLLLGRGGAVVYEGPARHAVAYIEGAFAAAGAAGEVRRLPEHTNPADWLMDVVSGAVEEAAAEGAPDWTATLMALEARDPAAPTTCPSAAASQRPQQCIAADWPALWRAHCARLLVPPPPTPTAPLLERPSFVDSATAADRREGSSGTSSSLVQASDARLNARVIHIAGASPPAGGPSADRASFGGEGALAAVISPEAGAPAALAAASTAPTATADAGGDACVLVAATVLPSVMLGRDGSACAATAEAVPRADYPSFAVTLRLALWSSALVGLRDRASLLVFTLLHVVTAAALSTGFSAFIQGSPRSSINPPVISALVPYCPGIVAGRCAAGDVDDLGLQQLLFFASIALGSSSSMAAIRVFGGTGQPQWLRRLADAGLPMLAIGLGAMLADLMVVALDASIFTAVWCLLGNTGEWQLWLATFFLTSFAASGVGYTASLVAGVADAGVLCMLAVVVFSVFSGVQPTLSQVQRLSVVAAPWYVSFGTWTAEACYIVFTAWLRGTRRIADGAAAFGYGYSLARPLGALVGLGLAWRVVALTALMVKAHGSWRAAAAAAWRTVYVPVVGRQ